MGLSVIRTVSFQGVGDQEGQFQCLIGIEPRIAMGVVAIGEIGLGDLEGAADAFGNVAAGHLEMHATGITVFAAVYLKKALHLLQDTADGASLETTACFYGVAVHGVAAPEHFAAFTLDAF